MVTDIRHPARRFVPGLLCDWFPLRDGATAAPGRRRPGRREQAANEGDGAREALGSGGGFSWKLARLAGRGHGAASVRGEGWRSVGEGFFRAELRRGATRSRGWGSGACAPPVEARGGRAGRGSARWCEGREGGTRLGGARRGSGDAGRGSAAPDEAPRRRTRLRGAGRGSSRRHEGPTARNEASRRGMRLVPPLRGSDGAGGGSTARDQARPAATRVRRRRTRLRGPE